jgi:hypothetical protein
LLLPKPPGSAIPYQQAILCIIKSDCTHLLTPLAVGTRHTNRHLTQISHLLTLETIQVGLDSGAGIFEILSRKVKRILQLKKSVTFSH